jgi:alkanesulfonate monooxygenase SsuD/methylene tetrahydromethanopterin reductase-like flavin-dependent oxidoreductase (luciferase family)
VWVAGRSEPILAIAGRLADGWNGWGGTPADFARDAERVRAAAGERRVEMTWGGLVRLEDDDARGKKHGDRDRAGWLVGGPEAVARGLQGFIDAGATHLVCTFPDPGRPGVYEALGGEVLPLLGLR